MKVGIEVRGTMAGSLVHLLNTTTRMPFKILFVMLIGLIVFAFDLEVQCLHENEITAKYSGSCIQLT